MVKATAIFQAVIGVIATGITVFVIPLIKNRLDIEKRAALVNWVSIAVTAAEQLFAGSGRGKEKKAYVIDFLKSKGYTVDIENLLDSIHVLIEAVVYELKNE